MVEEQPEFTKQISAVSGMTWGSGADYDDDDWDESGVGVPGGLPNSLDINLDNDKGYKIVEVQSLSVDVITKLNDLRDLFDMDSDAIMILARHYNWSEQNMQNWFDQEERLKFSVGLVFDERLVQ